MDELRAKYEISLQESKICFIFACLRKNDRIPRILKKLSRKKYGKKDNVSRYYAEKYLGSSIGKYSYGWEQLIPNKSTHISVGSFCSIAANVSLAIGEHPTNFISTSPATYSASFGIGDTDFVEQEDLQNVIGNDVWIGRNVTILGNISIGNGAVIGAGTVLTKDVPDYAVVVGVPGKIIRYRFNEIEIKKLLSIQWWNWDDEKIKKYFSLFPTPQKFIDYF